MVSSSLRSWPQPTDAARPDSFECDLIDLRPALRTYARRLHSGGADAEDLVQDTLLKALAARHQFAPGTRLKSWLFTIMKNTFNTRYRRAAMGPRSVDFDLDDLASTPATQLTTLWTRQVIASLVNDLSPEHREVLILIPVMGLSYEHVASIQGCRVGTVKSRLSRARAALALLDDGAAP